MACSLPVALSRAPTLTIPLASMSNVTSIWGTPGQLGECHPVELAEQFVVCRHLTLALEHFDADLDWLSAAVEKLGSSWWESWCCAG